MFYHPKSELYLIKLFDIQKFSIQLPAIFRVFPECLSIYFEERREFCPAKICELIRTYQWTLYALAPNHGITYQAIPGAVNRVSPWYQTI